MGLDAVEFVMAVESTFGLAIPDADAAVMLTPGDVVAYLERRVSGNPVDGCLEQRAFYRLRRAAVQVLDRPRSAVTPDTPWAELLDSKRQGHQWKLLGRVVGTQPWPALKPFFARGAPTQRVRDTIHYLVTTAAASLMRGDEGWSRMAIENAVRKLIAEELAITDFKWTDRFVKDLGIN